MGPSVPAGGSAKDATTAGNRATRRAENGVGIAGGGGCSAVGDRRNVEDLGTVEFDGMWGRASTPTGATVRYGRAQRIPAIRVPERPGLSEAVRRWITDRSRDARYSPLYSKSSFQNLRYTATARDRCSPQKCSVGDLNSPRRARFAARDSSAQIPPCDTTRHCVPRRMLGRGFEPRSSARKAEMIGRTTPTERI